MRACWNSVLASHPICLFLGLVLVVGSTVPGWEQYTTTRLSGIVSDPSEAVVGGATITVEDLGTGYHQTTTSEPTLYISFPACQ